MENGLILTWMMNTMNKKCLLILGGGLDQVPGIIKAKDMELYTIVLDGNSDAVGKEYADEFYTVSIKHIKQIEEFIHNQLNRKVDGVIAFGVDIPLIIAKTADLLNINYTIPFESAKLSEDKFDSKEFMKLNNIPIPEYKIVSNIQDINLFIKNYGLPIVIKPVDNSAARGISYIDKQEDLEKYYNYALGFSKQKKVQVEQYLSGRQISSETLVINGNIHNIAFLDRHYNDMKKFLPNIIENGGDMPSIFMKEKHKKQLAKYFKIITNKLNIKNGIIKGDIVIHNDNLYIIEFALRLSGGNFSTVCIPESTGIDFIKIAIQLHLNINISNNDLILEQKNNYISMRYKFVEDLQCVRKLRIKEIKLPHKQADIILSNFHAKAGEDISCKTTDHAKRLGFAVARGENRKNAITTAQSFLDNVDIIFE
ncbi:MAG: hypothetical protein DRG78_17615 [Epsilonproteobacteria bacterium]|nr:MAG: hypothetical protein DRG78_17615 [Campylobacterota bacterium]